MIQVSPDAELAALLAWYDKVGGVLDFNILRPEEAMESAPFHRSAALAGMATLARGRERWAETHASEEYPVDVFLHVEWDEFRLIGGPVPFSTFWGTDDVKPKPIGERAWSIPSVDGYKTAFFLPPHNLRGSWDEQDRLFNGINASIFGPVPLACEVYSWSTDWSNYFDAGNEWWGAFYWTVRPINSNLIVVIGASTTD